VTGVGQPDTAVEHTGSIRHCRTRQNERFAGAMQDIGHTAKSILRCGRAVKRIQAPAACLATRMGPDHGGFPAFLHMFE
jgi:hypothetical protein